MPPPTAATKASAAIQPDVLIVKIADTRRSRPARVLSDMTAAPWRQRFVPGVRNEWLVNRFGVLEVAPIRGIRVQTMKVDPSTW
jgi:hypothetical protein